MNDDLAIKTGWLEVPVTAGNAQRASAMKAYLARPDQPGPWPAVLVGFEMFGITGFVCQVADRLARAAIWRWSLITTTGRARTARPSNFKPTPRAGLVAWN